MAASKRQSAESSRPGGARTGADRRRRLIDYPRRGYTGVRRWLPSWRFLVGSFIACVFGVLGVGVAAYAFTDIPDPDSFVEAQVSTVYYSDGTTKIGTFPGPNRTLVDYADLPEYIGQAVVSSEDRTFFENQGISVTGIARAFLNNITGGSTQGASTLTQQYVERYYVGETTNTYLGKAQEALRAIKISQTETKEQILGRYLNTIYFGRDSYGIEAAAQAYFGKSAADLSLSEAAMLAGIIPSPNNWDPAVSPEKAQQRWESVLDGMVRDEWITQATRDEQVFPETVTYTRSDTYGGTNGYLLQFVKDELTAAGIQDEAISSGGLRVVTTIDANAQNMAVDSVNQLRAGTLSDGETPSEALKVGIVTLDPDNGAIVAMYGGADFLADQYNRATYPVQAGSTFKPFTLIAALQDGIPLTARYSGASPQTIEGWEGGSVSNFGGTSYGTIDLVTATAQSVNTVYAALNVEVGADRTAAVAQQAGLSPPITAVPSNVLGVDDVKPLDMANAYGTIAAQGVRHTTHMVSQVTDSKGQVTHTGPTAGEQVIAGDVMADTTYAMTRVVEEGSGRTHIKPLGREIAGKTGTSTDNKSAWFVGFTPDVVTAVAMSQVGENGSDRATITPWGGVSEVTGSTWPAALWASYMEKVFTLDQFSAQTPFPERANVNVDATATSTPIPTATEEPTEAPPEESTTVAVPSGLEGRLIADAQAALQNAGLSVQVTNQASDTVPAGSVISVSPGGGSQVASGSAVTLVVSTGPAAVVPEPEPTEPPAAPTTNPPADTAAGGTG